VCAKRSSRRSREAQGTGGGRADRMLEDDTLKERISERSHPYRTVQGGVSERRQPYRTVQGVSERGQTYGIVQEGVSERGQTYEIVQEGVSERGLTGLSKKEYLRKDLRDYPRRSI